MGTFWIRVCLKLKPKMAKQRIFRFFFTVMRPKTYAWVNYLVYRDLRSRGYVVREGFGGGIDFRIYERGAYGKDTAPYLVLNTQEGKPLPINDLAGALQQVSEPKERANSSGHKPARRGCSLLSLSVKLQQNRAGPRRR